MHEKMPLGKNGHKLGAANGGGSGGSETPLASPLDPSGLLRPPSGPEAAVRRGVGATLAEDCG